MTAPFAPVTPEQERLAVLAREAAEYADAHRGEARHAAARGAIASAERAAAASAERAARAAAWHPGPDLAPGRGLPPAYRAQLIAGAKKRAGEFLAAVAAGDAQRIQRMTAGWSPAAWRAVAIVFAEAADPERLRAVVAAADDGLPAHLSPEGRTRAA